MTFLCQAASRSRVVAFSLIEIMVAIAILGFCFLPILTQSKGTIKETEVSQEDLIARHYLIDLVERFKGSPLDELRELSSIANFLKTDSMLTDHARIAAEMEALALSTGKKADQGLKGMKQYLDTVTMMNLTPQVTFQENVQPGVHLLTCAVTWSSKVRAGERRIAITKVLAR